MEGEGTAIFLNSKDLGLGRAPVGGKSLGCFGFPVSIAAASIWKFVRVLAATLRGGGGSEGKIGEKNFLFKKNWECWREAANAPRRPPACGERGSFRGL